MLRLHREAVMRRWIVVLATMVMVSFLAVPIAPAGDGAHGRAVILRDEYGVPHIYATNTEALFYAVGYAQGQDRLWQADVFRRLGTGTLAELLGAGSAGGDVFARTMFGPPQRRADMLATASEETQTILEAFSDGMNAWISEATAAGKLPIEYQAFGLTPRPWTPDDSVATFMFFASFFGWFGNDELANAQQWLDLSSRLDPAEAAAAFADTHWLNDADAPTTAPGAPTILATHGAVNAPVLPAGTAKAAVSFQAAVEDWQAALQQAGLRPGPASNAIVIAPQLSASGSPLLLGGPQMDYAAPQINHEIGIHGAGFDVTGMELAGWPLVPVGVGRGYAWTLTSGGSDNSDIYAETVNPDNPLQYWFDGAWVDFDCRAETVNVLGGDPIDQQICTSVHGPVIAAADGTAFTLRNAVVGLEMQSYDAWLGLAKATSIREFATSLADVAYNFNVLYADRRGNIAYFHVGKVPIRAEGDNPWFPHDGSGTVEWQGFVPWKAMPRAINPRRGWMASWNNKPQADWSNSSGGFWMWGPVHRVNTLFALLDGMPRHSADMATLEAINRQAGWTTDTPSGNASAVFTSSLLDELVAAVDTTADPRLDGVIEVFDGWDLLQIDGDGDGRYDQPAVAVFNTWWPYVVDGVFGDELGASLDATVAGSLVARMLDPDPALPLLVDYLDGATATEAVTAALVAAVDDLTASFGSADPASWLQDVAHIVWAPSGAGAVPDTIWMNRGTYNQIVRVGWLHTEAENVVAPGQSGDPLSPHFADQLELYATWTYKPMRLTVRDLFGHIESSTVLVV